MASSCCCTKQSAVSGGDHLLVCIPLVALLAHRHCLFHWVASRPLICSLWGRRRPCRCATGSQECNSPLAMGTLGTLRRWDAGTLERHDAAYLDTAQPQQTRSQPMFPSAMSPAWPLGVGADSPAMILSIPLLRGYFWIVGVQVFSFVLFLASLAGEEISIVCGW